MLKPMLNGLLLIFAVALSSCASDSRRVNAQPSIIPAPPAAVMIERRPDFESKMRNFLFESPSEPTETPGS